MRKVSMLLALLMIFTSSVAFASEDVMVVPVMISAPIEVNPVESSIPFDVDYNGDEFTVTVELNSGTPYQWYYKINDIMHVSYVGTETEIVGEAMPGGPLNVNATFVVNDKGISTIDFELKSFVDGDIAKTLNLLVYKTDNKLIVEENKTMYAMDSTVVQSVIGKKFSYMGTEIESDLEMIKYDGVTMLPLRDVVEAMGYTVTWNAEKRSVGIMQGPQWTEIFIGENSYFKNRMAAAPLSAAPIIKNGSTYVPLEFFVEILSKGIEVNMGNINFTEAKLPMGMFQGYVKAINYDETGMMRITLTTDYESDDIALQTIIHTSKNFTYFNKQVVEGEMIKVITSPIMTMSMPGQTSGYIIY